MRKILYNLASLCYATIFLLLAYSSAILANLTDGTVEAIWKLATVVFTVLWVEWIVEGAVMRERDRRRKIRRKAR